MRAGGWLSAGISYNGNQPRNHSNAPVTFNDRASELQLNQLNLFLERAVNKEAKHWDIGGRVDFLWGTDSRFTQAAGHWDDDLIDASQLRFYDIALPQAYLEIATPLARGATVKIGHFYTLLGHESVPAPQNFFYSHSYLMQYAEPFTHTGVLLNYPLRGNASLNLGAVTGPWRKSDNFDKHLSNWNFLGGISWSSEDGGASLALALTSGAAEAKTGHNRTIASLVWTFQLSERLHYVLQGDYGFQEQAKAGRDAYWHGVSQYLIYTLSQSLSLGLRGEWLRDSAGFRVVETPGSYYESSVGLDWRPENKLLLRLEARNDWADSRGKIFDAGTRRHQFTLGANAVLSF
jgi:hypothetical protein